MRRWIAFGLALVVAAASGCTSMVPLDPGNASEVAARVQPGDTVALVTRAGVRAEIVVTAVDATSITGNGVRFPLADLESLQVQKADAARTGIGAIVVLYVVAIVAALVWLASGGLSPGMPG